MTKEKLNITKNALGANTSANNPSDAWKLFVPSINGDKYSCPGHDVKLFK